MSENTFIEWCDSTFNPWIGCTRVSPACDDCYAARSTPARTLGVVWGAHEPRRRTGTENWKQPLRWESKAAEFFEKHGRRRRVFSASLADVFDNAVPSEWREELFELIRITPNLDWLLLTKRIGNVGNMLPVPFDFDKHYPNVWLGATIVNQEEADRDIPKLLGPVNLTCMNLNGYSEIYPLSGTSNCEDDDGNPAPDLPSIDWVIVGGESGPGARPMHPDWVRSLRHQCAAADVPYLFKQWGEWLPAKEGRSITGKTHVLEGSAPFTSHPEWHGFEGGQQVARVGKKAAGRLLDGVDHIAFPHSNPENPCIAVMEATRLMGKSRSGDTLL